jgi:hypothetical protein
MRVLLLAMLLLVAPLHAGPDVPPLTELERLKIENVRLEGALIQRELDDWQAKKARLKLEIDAARPGWTWEPESGVFTATKPTKGDR